MTVEKYSISIDVTDPDSVVQPDVVYVEYALDSGMGDSVALLRVGRAPLSLSDNASAHEAIDSVVQDVIEQLSDICERRNARIRELIKEAEDATAARAARRQ